VAMGSIRSPFAGSRFVGRQIVPTLLAISASVLVACSFLMLMNWSGNGVLLILGLALAVILVFSFMKPALPLILMFVFLSSPLRYILEARTSAFVVAALLACGILSGIVPMSRTRSRASEPLASKILLLGGCAVASALFGFWMGNESSYVLGDLFQVVEFVLVFILCTQLIVDRKTLRQVLTWTLISILLNITWQFYLFAQGRVADPAFFYYGGTGLTGSIPRTINFDALAAFSILLCLYPFLVRLRDRIGLLVVLAYVAANLILSFARGLWIGALAAVVTSAWLLKGAERRKLLRILSLLLLGVASAAGIWKLPTAGPGVDLIDLIRMRYEYTFAELGEGGAAPAVEPRRVGEFEAIAPEILKSPLLGKGLGGTYRIVEPDVYGIPIVSEEHFIHNLYLSVAFRMGLVGLMVFVWVIFLYFRYAQATVNLLPDGLAKGLVAGFVSSLAGMAAVSMTSPTLLNHPTAAFAAGLMALSLRINRGAVDVSSNSRARGESSPASLRQIDPWRH
jgi:O-antigen ligase